MSEQEHEDAIAVIAGEDADGTVAGCRLSGRSEKGPFVRQDRVEHGYDRAIHAGRGGA